jgi:hypothetical protein
MSAFLNDLAGSPIVYPQKIDVRSGRVLLIRLSQAAYNRASFLDDRVLEPGTEGAWETFDAIERASTQIRCARPLHFIFHTGHVGSTLLSRLLDASGFLLGLREPLPLRALAELHDRLPGTSIPGGKFGRMRDTFLRLWGRGFPETKAVVLKATSVTGRLASVVLSARPRSRAIYLNLHAEPYLATLLAGTHSILDLKGYAPERLSRLSKIVGNHGLLVEKLSAGELAATSWLTERLTQERAIRENPDRVLPLDFDALLSNLEKNLTKVLSHFGFKVSDEIVQAMATSPNLMRYSKAPDQYEYSPAFRAQLLDQARREQAHEIQAGLRLLDSMAAQFPAVSAVL